MSVVVDLRYADVNPVAPIGVDVLTKTLFRRVSVGVVEAEIALDPKRAPLLVPFR